MVLKRNASRTILIEELSKGICKVFFRKMTNGRFRSLYCTLKYNALPRDNRKYIEQIFSSFKNDLDLIPVYDIVDSEWKSFRLSTILQFYTNEDLMKSETEKRKVKVLEQ